MRFLAHFSTIKGRTTRKEYWIYGGLIGSTLNLIASFVVSSISTMILCFAASKSAGFTSCTDAVWPGTVGQAIGVLVASVVSVFVIVPLAIKRSHDLGKSGHFLWLLLIPLYGVWPMIQLTFIKGEACSNQYGASPYDVIS